LTTGASQYHAATCSDSGRLTLEAHTGDITLRLALATETGEEDLVVLVDKVQATIVGDCTSISACTT
jgi:predicted LPLAT superfamily acyltransferase